MGPDSKSGCIENTGRVSAQTVSREGMLRETWRLLGTALYFGKYSLPLLNLKSPAATIGMGLQCASGFLLVLQSVYGWRLTKAHHGWGCALGRKVLNSQMRVNPPKFHERGLALTPGIAGGSFIGTSILRYIVKSGVLTAVCDIGAHVAYLAVQGINLYSISRLYSNSKPPFGKLDQPKVSRGIDKFSRGIDLTLIGLTISVLLLNVGIITVNDANPSTDKFAFMLIAPIANVSMMIFSLINLLVTGVRWWVMPPPSEPLLGSDAFTARPSSI